MFEVSMVKPSFEVNVMHTPEADTALPLPGYATDGAAGMDVRANLAPDLRADGGVTIGPGERKLIGTGSDHGNPCWVRDAGAAPVRARAQVWHHAGQLARHDRQRLSRRSGDHPDQPVGYSRFMSPMGTGSLRWSLRPWTRCEWRVVSAKRATERGGGGFGSTGV